MTAALNISETGRRACLAGLKASDNPFKIGSQARSLWAKGYRKAREDEVGAIKESRAATARVRERREANAS